MDDASPFRSAPPIADRRPHSIEQLGRVRNDDYAWLKDEDWQKVMRDPRRAPLGCARAPGGGERLHGGPARFDPGAAGGAVRRDAPPYQGGRQLSSLPRRPLRLLRALRDRRPASGLRAQAPRRRRRAGAAGRRRGRGGQGLLRHRGDRAQRRPRLVRLRPGRAGLGILPHRGEGPRHRRSAARSGGQLHRRLRHLPGQRLAVLGLARRERPPRQGLPPPRARRRGRAGLCRTRRRHVPVGGRDPEPGLHRHRRGQPRDQRSPPDPRDRPNRRAQDRRAPQGRAPLRTGALERPLRGADQCGRCGGLQTLLGGRGRPVQSRLARLDRPRSRAFSRRHGRPQELVRAAGAGGCGQTAS